MVISSKNDSWLCMKLGYFLPKEIQQVNPGGPDKQLSY